MNERSYFFKTILAYIRRIQSYGNIDESVQKIYNQFGYGYDEYQDAQLLMSLQSFNQNLSVPYLATGQNGYFNEQIDENGLSHLKVDIQDIDDLRFIAECFNKRINYQNNDISLTYVTLLGTTEFNYACQSFPAGIFEDVFLCDSTHNLPIQPLVGESEQDFYLRLLEYQIDNSVEFKQEKKSEVLFVAKRVIEKFCKNKNRVYLISLDDALKVKASFGDISGLRDGELSTEESLEKIASLGTLRDLMTSFYIQEETAYQDPNMTSEYGIALYGDIPKSKLKYIEVDRAYQIMQKKAIEMGINYGEEIPKSYSQGIGI